MSEFISRIDVFWFSFTFVGVAVLAVDVAIRLWRGRK
jgi:hypothetical protein